ncbi:MAG TPA: hypothetical protein VFW40_04845 [Capsulimonadaceae bacterium]|nr:hypothetical protein [Capsulimonadaceae bacterium]
MARCFLMRAEPPSTEAIAVYQGYNAMPGRVRFEWIGESWQLFRAQWATWVPTTLLFGVIYFGILIGVAIPLGFWSSWMYLGAHIHDPGAFTRPGAPASPGLAEQLLYEAVAWTVVAFFYGGLFKMANKQVRGEAIGVGDLFSGGSTFLPMLGFVIVFNLLQLAGMLCFCLGIFVVFALFWPAFALIADGVGFGDAFTRSFEGMKQDWLTAALYVIVFGLIVLLSCLAFGLGTLITVPMVYLSTSLAYRDMIGMPGSPGGGYPVAGGYYPGQAVPGSWPPPPGQIPPGPNNPPSGWPPPSQ